MSNMFEGTVDLDPNVLKIEDMDFVLGVRLYSHTEFGYITIMENPDGGIMVQQLPEAMQNMIPAYLPMVMEALGNGG